MTAAKARDGDALRVARATPRSPPNNRAAPTVGSGMARTHPDRLVFDDDPADDELAVPLGPDFAARELRWHERDGVVRIGPPRIPVAGAAIFLAWFGAVLSAAPWVLPGFGIRLPAHVTPELVVGLTAAYWLLVAPAFVGLLAFLDGVHVRRVRASAVLD